MRLLRQAAAGPRPWAACSPPASTLTLLLLSLLAAAALARHHPPEGKIVYTIAGVDSDGAKRNHPVPISRSLSALSLFLRAAVSVSP